ncbi:MAG TPA: Gfo/Idh/MocA family oxidoreductase [Planctomycetaceae bacterium]|nr:Gfo/Idh/MocA family oxidoreductase [Planctomycetaceae bacterium]
MRRIGVIGLGRRGWFHLERFRLRDDIQVAAVTDASAELREQARQSRWTVVDSIEALLAVKPLDGVLIACPPEQRDDLVPRCLQAGLHVCVEPPLAANVPQARRWLSLAERSQKTLQLAPWRRWDPQFATANSAVATGRLGILSAARLTVAEWTPLAGDALPDTNSHESAEAQFGPHGFDQLLQLMTADPTSIWARRLPDEDGFLAVIDFADGSFAEIDFRRRTRTGQSTGWVLEGNLGSYRQERIVTVSPDGELIDEPVPGRPESAQDELRSWFATATDTAEHRRAWQGVGLIRAVTLACDRGGPVRWDEVVGS